MSQTFADLGLSERAVSALADRGITNPLPVQELVIADALTGRDVLCKSPTGSGKTFAFGLPMLERVERGGAQAQALVLAPTRELASQIVDELSCVADAKRITVAAVYGGANIGPQMKRVRDAEVVVATPGRLVDLIERRAVSLKRVSIVVLDEADRMLDMGFKPVVERLMNMMPADRQVLLFSATLEGQIAQIANKFTRDAIRHEHQHAEAEQGKIEHRFHRIEHAAKTDRLIEELNKPERGRTLVFVRTKRGADRLAKRLSTEKISVAAMHGNKTQSQREKALARFENGQIDTLVATDVAARGIDVANVTHVINFDVPGAREDYVHRAGRTARAGASGVSITYVMSDQERDFRRFAEQLGLHAELATAGLIDEHGKRHGAPSDGGHSRHGNGGAKRRRGRSQQGSHRSSR